jgi:hypothetical protein
MATAELKPDRYEAYDKGDFVCFDEVPVFDQHTGSDGTVYDEKLLQSICDNLNDRIADSGDYPAITDGHTNDHGNPQPEVLGFAGPFRLKKFGNVRPRWCIYGRFNVFKNKEETFRARPRRSVELWPEDKPENRYFDPIAVLGAESPRRGLGLIYSKRNPSNVERYSMATATSPGGTNTFVPGMADDKKKPERYEEPQQAGKFSEEMIDQLIEALKPVVRAIVAEMTAPEDPEDAEQLDEEPKAETPERMAEEETQTPETEEPMATAAEPEKYAKLQTEVEKYRKEAGDARKESEQYKKDLTTLQDHYAKLNERVATIDGERRQAVRYSKLEALSNQGYCFEVAEEAKDTADMSDEAFERHITKTVTKYTKVPLNRSLPIPAAEAYATDEKAQKYAKAARDLCIAERSKGINMTYVEALEKVKSLNGAAK